MISLYRFVLHPALVLAAIIASPWRPKVRKTLRQRIGWRMRPIAIPAAARFRILAHAASVGEFEQLKPILRALRSSVVDCWICATFSSTSGLEARASAAEVDQIKMLPIDTRRSMRQFLGLMAPDLILVGRYDLWPVMIDEACRQRTPVALVCGTMHQASRRFHPLLRSLFRKTYEQLTIALVVSDEDASALRQLAPGTRVHVCGDSRYDRVMERATTRGDLPLPPPPDGRPVLVVGSAWHEDEQAILGMVSSARVRLIIAPHEPTVRHLQSIEHRVGECTRLSDCRNRWPQGPVIVDSMGLLSSLYGLGDLAWVGGGFGTGVHSVLEPAAHGIPVLCGPRIHRSRDALEMEKAGLLTVVSTPAEAAHAIDRFLNDVPYREAVGEASREFVLGRSGATNRVLKLLVNANLVPVAASMSGR